MASFPVPVNNNLNQNVNQTPIAGVGAEGSLGGVRVDGSSIDVDPATGVISVAGAGGGVISGSGTPGFIPEFTAAQKLGDSPLDDGITLPGTVTSNEPLAVYPVNPPGGLCVDIEVANITTPQTGEFDLVYITDSAPATTFETNVLLELDPAGTGTVGNQALHITNGLAAGGTNFAIKSDSPAQSVFAGSLASPILVATPTAGDPASPANGDIWYNSTTNQLKARINGATIVLSPAMTNIISSVTLAGAVLNGNVAQVGAGGSATIDIQNIPSTFTHLRLYLHGANSSGSDQGSYAQFNNDSTAGHYAYEYQYALSSGTSTPGGAASSTEIYLGNITASTGNDAGALVLDIPNYANTSFMKRLLSRFDVDNGTNNYGGFTGGKWNQTSAINRITLSLNSGVFVQNTYLSLYGIS